MKFEAINNCQDKEVGHIKKNINKYIIIIIFCSCSIKLYIKLEARQTFRAVNRALRTVLVGVQTSEDR